ncbi:hypothetical protein ZYGR_0N04670 [Zygosaccharomyces rouxii]|uniref:Uncharacterized protein n=1 Tax=Zygosaccharomyces rouxii TaxID=4956 RepID=A0A1Q3A064_ZYGRO|nr:hypothetical protein ZYGR_0N04670 [Zygosaccharomyces rouxii]
MRAPPPPRRSKSRYLTTCYLRIKQVFTGSKLKKRWHLHKLHKFRRKGQLAVSPISGIHVEDMVNLPTGLQNRSSKGKPLLIAAFSKGCTKSPQLRLLQRNKFYGLPMTTRKYKLKSFDTTVTEKKTATTITQRTHLCAPRVGSLKKATSKDADIKVIFHNNNVIKSINLEEESHTTSYSPQLLEFAPQQSIRIKDYPSLARRPLGLAEISENENVNDNNPNGYLRLRNEKSKSGPLAPAINPPAPSLSIDSGSTAVSADMRTNLFQWKTFIRITKYSNKHRLVSYSRLITSYTS